MSHLASLSLFAATPEQKLVSRRRTWMQWGGRLTEEEYLRRDDVLSQLEHAKDGKLMTWVLAPRDEPDTLDFMCSCETHQRAGFWLNPQGANSDVQKVSCYGIASVYTPPAKRGRGYASHMMRLLHWIIAPRGPEFSLGEFPEAFGAPPPQVEGVGNGFFSALYSDVGSEFYKKCGPGAEPGGGWEVRGAVSSVWDVQEKPLQIEDRGTDFKWLRSGDLAEVWAKDVEIMRQEILDARPLYNGKDALVAYRIDGGVGAFPMQRMVLGESVPMDTWGVVITPTEDSLRLFSEVAYATWSVDVRPEPPTLIVTRLRTSEKTFSLLLQKILDGARHNSITRIEIWNLPQHLHSIAEQLGGKTTKRAEHLPAIKWYGKGRTENIEWLFNEKFCWC